MPVAELGVVRRRYASLQSMTIAQAVPDMSGMGIGAIIAVICLFGPPWLLIIGWVGRKRSIRCSRVSFLLSLVLSFCFLAILFRSGASSQPQAGVFLTLAGVFVITSSLSLFFVRESLPNNRNA